MARGLFRLWIVISGFWLVLAVAVFFGLGDPLGHVATIWSGPPACPPRPEGLELGNAVEGPIEQESQRLLLEAMRCEAQYLLDQRNAKQGLTAFGLAATILPAALGLIFASIVWVVRGFRRPK